MRVWCPSVPERRDCGLFQQKTCESNGIRDGEGDRATKHSGSATLAQTALLDHGAGSCIQTGKEVQGGHCPSVVPQMLQRWCKRSCWSCRCRRYRTLQKA